MLSLHVFNSEKISLSLANPAYKKNYISFDILPSNFSQSKLLQCVQAVGFVATDAIRIPYQLQVTQLAMIQWEVFFFGSKGKMNFSVSVAACCHQVSHSHWTQSKLLQTRCVCVIYGAIIYEVLTRNWRGHVRERVLGTLENLMNYFPQFFLVALGEVGKLHTQEREKCNGIQLNRQKINYIFSLSLVAQLLPYEIYWILITFESLQSCVQHTQHNGQIKCQDFSCFLLLLLLVWRCHSSLEKQMT